MAHPRLLSTSTTGTTGTDVSWLLQRRHLIMALVWVGLSVPTLLFWKDSVLWVAFLSLYANFASEVASHHALRAKEEVTDNGSSGYDS